MEFAVKDLPLANVFLFLVRGASDQLLTGYKFQQVCLSKDFNILYK